MEEYQFWVKYPFTERLKLMFLCLLFVWHYFNSITPALLFPNSTGNRLWPAGDCCSACCLWVQVQSAARDATSYFLWLLRKIIYAFPHEQRNKSKLVNQLPYARPFRGGIIWKEKRKKGKGPAVKRRNPPGGNAGVTSHKRNVRCGLID